MSASLLLSLELLVNTISDVCSPYRQPYLAAFYSDDLHLFTSDRIARISSMYYNSAGD
jgi:hypothetical protein